MAAPLIAVPRQKTALTRTDLSRPLKQALEDGVLAPGMTVFDYGCGRGGDVERLRGLQFSCEGWDPAFRPEAPRRPASVVNLGYVVNVIESPLERGETLRRAWSLAEHILVVSARLQHEARDLEPAATLEDGLLTRTGTFQKFFDQQELKAWIEATCKRSPIPA